MSRAPELREVCDESTIVVHRTHDRDQAMSLVLDHYAGTERRWLDGVPDYAQRPEQGECVWLRVNPAPRDHEYAFFYAAAAEGERGAFQAVVFSGEQIHWWHGRGKCPLMV